MKNLLKNTEYLLVLLILSCTSEELQNFDERFKESSNAKTKICLDKFIDNGQQGQSGKALEKAKLWNNGRVLKVKFLGGSSTLQEKIFDVAEAWEEFANIDFQRVTSGDADIRISIVNDGSSWSYIGTDANNISQSSATMNFGWFDDTTSEREIYRTTLHEFGHALGAIHEHSSPVADINWDREAVYEYYEQFDWTRSDVDRNLFFKYSNNLITNSEYDPLSIMHYPINSDLTLDGYSVSWNYELSDLDKSFIGETYPFNTEKTVTNLALGKETQQISTHSGLPGQSGVVVDGNTSGKWSEGSISRTATEERPWWQVRLGDEYEIGDIIIWNRTDSCCAYKLDNFDVFIYNDAGEQVYKTTINEIPSPNVVINAGGALGSRVRVKLKDVNQLSISEVEVYEY